MASDNIKTDGDPHQMGTDKKVESQAFVNSNDMTDAYDGENREHEEGMWSSVKSHPWACFWSFIMCFTIVSGISMHKIELTRTRSWNPLICF